MTATELATEAFKYVTALSPLLLLISGISFADLATNFIINLVKKAPRYDRGRRS